MLDVGEGSGKAFVAEGRAEWLGHGPVDVAGA